MYYLAVYVAIGNSDDKLTQAQWSHFCQEVDDAVRQEASEVHGEWYSPPAMQYQNACWSIVFNDRSRTPRLQDRLARLADKYDQDSIVWSEANVTFIRPVA